MVGDNELELRDAGYGFRGAGSAMRVSSRLNAAAHLPFGKFNPDTICWSYGAGGIKVEGKALRVS